VVKGENVMQVAIVGATGVLGRNLLPRLLAEGHRVRALARTPAQAQALTAQGVEPVEGDLLAPDAAERLRALVAGCDALVHAATAIPADSGAPGAWEANTRLRTHGTGLLLDAALAAGVAAYVQQSIVMAYPGSGDRWLDETTPLDTSPDRASVVGPVAIMEGLVQAVAPERLRWCILRGGAFAGPGTAQEQTLARLRGGTEIVPCDGRNFLSPIHLADMAEAVLLAVRRAPAGSIFNICDEPLRQGEYMDRLAALIGVPPPPRAPARPCPPSWRCGNYSARTELAWEPRQGIWPPEAAAAG
jgi:nucleoside-diphosphate-sugar epimerase